ncbi:MAG: hypothetical protein IPL26_23210 [Leptospiraceae bacterium]|nr:hypothetical protein [Leptospiraceae bacterium]
MYRILSVFLVSMGILGLLNCKKATESSTSIVGHWQGNAEVAKDGETVLTASAHVSFSENGYTIENEGKTKAGEGTEECAVKVVSEGTYSVSAENITLTPSKESMEVCGQPIDTKLESDTYHISLEGDNLTLSQEEGGSKTITTLKRQ